MLANDNAWKPHHHICIIKLVESVFDSFSHITTHIIYILQQSRIIFCIDYERECFLKIIFGKESVKIYCMYSPSMSSPYGSVGDSKQLLNIQQPPPDCHGGRRLPLDKGQLGRCQRVKKKYCSASRFLYWKGTPGGPASH